MESKEITLRNSQILNIVPALEALSGKDIPITIAFLIAKTLKTFDEELTTINEQRNKLINKYAEKDEEGNNVVTTSTGKVPNMTSTVLRDPEKYQDEVGNLLDMSQTLVVYPIKASKLGEINMKPAHILVLVETGVLEDG